MDVLLIIQHPHIQSFSPAPAATAAAATAAADVADGMCIAGP